MPLLEDLLKTALRAETRDQAEVVRRLELRVYPEDPRVLQTILRGNLRAKSLQLIRISDSLLRCELNGELLLGVVPRALVGARAVPLVQLVLNREPLLPLGVNHEVAVLSGLLRRQLPGTAHFN